jgi:type IV pilus assembly protein PilF
MKSSNIFGYLLIGMLLVACATNKPAQPDNSKSAIAARTYTQLGIEYIREKNYELALEKLQKAISLQPDYPVAHGAIAILYTQVGDKEKAEKHYKRGLSLDPDNADAHNNYGQFLCSDGRYEEAEKQFLIAANNPYYKTPQIPYLNAGLCMAGKPDPEAAEKYYRLALDKDPKYAPVLYQMAEASFAAQDYLKTRAWLQRFQEVGTQTPQSLWLGVRSEYALGSLETSGHYALQLKGRFPDSEQAGLLQEWEHERRSAK